MQSRKCTKHSWNPEQTPAYWINRASRALMRTHEERLRPLGFGMGQLPVLLALEDGAELSQKELATRAHVEQPTMAQALTRMERDGLLERRANPDDARSSLYSLERAARARIPELKAALLQGDRDACAGLSAAERTQLIELLRRVASNLEA